ncbi:Crp/Fnr family transcriptional regulator [Allohahella marinimesophila]|uniref:Crp/Fnr family transcriptional regulator n=2 Tax=Allohahella marinimesophila TaxID=1054972 RepID=A0ABP7PC51_9GAMM
MQGRWFKTLPEALRQYLLTEASEISLAPGARLFARDDAADGLYAVVQGSIRISSGDDQAREAILAFVSPPEWFGEIALFDGKTRTHDAFAAGETQLVHVDQDRLLGFLREYPRYWQDLGLLLTTKLRQTFSFMEDATLLPSSVRMARRLASMVENFGEQAGRSRRVVELQQDQLAKLIGVSRQTCNQILKELESQGCISIAYGRIEILDSAALRQFVPQKGSSR